MKKNRYHIRSPRRQRGIVLPVTVIAMVALLACVAFALDIGHIYLNKARIQNLVDFAALSAGKTMVSTGSKDQAITDARRTFFLNIRQTVDGVTTNVGANDELLGIQPADVEVDFSDTLDPWNSGGEPARFVKVEVNRNQLPTWFMQIVTGVDKIVPAHAVSGAIPVAPCDVFPVTVCALGGEDVTSNVSCGSDPATCLAVDADTGAITGGCTDPATQTCCEQDVDNPGSCATQTDKVFDEDDRANNYGLKLASATYQNSGAAGTDPSFANRQYCLKYSTNQSSDAYCDAAGYVKCGEYDGTTNDCVGDFERTFVECTDPVNQTCNTVDLTDDRGVVWGPDTVQTSNDAGTVPIYEPLKYTDEQLADQGLESGNFHVLQGNEDGGRGNIRDEFAGISSMCLPVNVGESENIEVETLPGNRVGQAVQGANARMNCYSGPMDPNIARPDYVSNVGQRQDPLDEGCDLDNVIVGYETDPDTGEYILGANGEPIPKTQESWGGSYDNDLADEYWQDYGYNSAAPDDIAAGAVAAGFDASCLSNGNCSTFDTDVVQDGGKLRSRVFAVPITNCSGIQHGQTTLQVLSFGCFLMTRPMVQQGNKAFLMGQFLGLSSADNLNPAAAPCEVSEGEINVSNSGGSSGPSKIVLFKSPAREDS